MKLPNIPLLQNLRNDPIFSRVIKTSSHFFSSSTISTGLSVLQSVLAARLLGVASFGLLGMVMSYTTSINRLLSFRMSETVVRYGGEYLEQKDEKKLAALIKASSYSEGIVSIIAFLVVILSADLATRFILKTPDTQRLLTLYAFGLLANFNVETSTGILQITKNVKQQGYINLFQAVVTASIITTAYFVDGSLEMVLAGYLIGKAISGLGILIVAQLQLRKVLQTNWLQASIQSLPKLKEMGVFAFTSNLSATAILAFRESELLWIGLFLSSEAAGYYKAAYAIVSLLSVPANPLILTTYPEFNRLIVQKSWARLKDFLRKVTSFSLLYNSAIAIGLIVFGKFILRIYGEEYVPAYPALLALLVGFVFNYIFFWNRPILLSLGLPGFPFKSTLVAGTLKIALAFPLVPRFGYIAEAGLLSFYYVISVGANVVRGVLEIRTKEKEITAEA